MGRREGRNRAMRKMVRATVSIAALLVAAGARAQMPVTDVGNLMNTTRSVIQGAQQIQQLTQQIQTMEQQLQQMQQVYASIAHLPDQQLQQLGAALNVGQFRNPLPSTSGAIGSLLNGSGLNGSTNLGSLSGVGQQYLNQNRIYSAPDSDAGTNSMTNNAASIAATQGIADQLYQSAADHTRMLQNLEGALANAPDEKGVADISARVQLEQAYVANQQVQAQAVATWQQSQVRNYEQQRRESRRCHIDQVLNDTVSQDAGSDPCLQPASSAASGGVTLASAGTGAAASVSSGYSQFLGQSVGSGQCVALVQAADSNVGLTRTWTQGQQVMGNTSLQPGTAIATFDGSGHYANATDGSSHAAVYLGQNDKGIQVEDQWLGQPAHTRTIPWSNTTGASNTGSAFYVISH